MVLDDIYISLNLIFIYIFIICIGHYGRVQIKVYRGPTTHGGHEHFAPHGFWVKQPADDGHH